MSIVIGDTLIIDQIFLAQQIKASVIICKKVVFTSFLTSYQTI